MDPAHKKRLLDYSANPAPEGFRSWREFDTVQKVDENGNGVVDSEGLPKMIQREKPRWQTGQTVEWLRRYGRQMALNACDQGWHMQLIDYVQHRHRLPNDTEIEQLVLDRNKIVRTNLPTDLIETQTRLKAELSEPLSLRATG